jgi:hypothetical protein
MRPLFWSLFRWGYVMDWMTQMRSAILISVFFLALHMSFSNKFERFLIPLLPILLLFLSYWVSDKIKSFPIQKLNLALFFGLNFLLLALTFFQTPQRNLLELGDYLYKHPEIKQLASYRGSIELLPVAFAGREIRIQDASNPADLAVNCDRAVIISERHSAAVYPELQSLRLLKHFGVSWLDRVLFQINPSHNSRRVGLSLYGCPDSKPDVASL